MLPNKVNLIMNSGGSMFKLMVSDVDVCFVNMTEDWRDLAELILTDLKQVVFIDLAISNEMLMLLRTLQASNVKTTLVSDITSRIGLSIPVEYCDGNILIVADTSIIGLFSALKVTGFSRLSNDTDLFILKGVRSGKLSMLTTTLIESLETRLGDEPAIQELFEQYVSLSVRKSPNKVVEKSELVRNWSLTYALMVCGLIISSLLLVLLFESFRKNGLF